MQTVERIVKVFEVQVQGVVRQVPELMVQEHVSMCRGCTCGWWRRL